MTPSLVDTRKKKKKGVYVIGNISLSSESFTQKNLESKTKMKVLDVVHNPAIHLHATENTEQKAFQGRVMVVLQEVLAVACRFPSGMSG